MSSSLSQSLSAMELDGGAHLRCRNRSHDWRLPSNATVARLVPAALLLRAQYMPRVANDSDLTAWSAMHPCNYGQLPLNQSSGGSLQL